VEAKAEGVVAMPIEEARPNAPLCMDHSRRGWLWLALALSVLTLTLTLTTEYAEEYVNVNEAPRRALNVTKKETLMLLCTLYIV
jgi:hypothetical protein